MGIKAKCNSYKTSPPQYENSLQAFPSLYTIFDQRRLDTIDQVEHGRSPQQLHIYPLCGIFYFPWSDLPSLPEFPGVSRNQA